MDTLPTLENADAVAKLAPFCNPILELATFCDKPKNAPVSV